MHVISRKALREAARTHKDLEAPLDAWYRVAKKSAWGSLNDIRLENLDPAGSDELYHLAATARVTPMRMETDLFEGIDE